MLPVGVEAALEPPLMLEPPAKSKTLRNFAPFRTRGTMKQFSRTKLLNRVLYRIQIRNSIPVPVDPVPAVGVEAGVIPLDPPN